jgi:hypothetical protein
MDFLQEGTEETEALATKRHEKARKGMRDRDESRPANHSEEYLTGGNGGNRGWFGIALFSPLAPVKGLVLLAVVTTALAAILG